MPKLMTGNTVTFTGTLMPSKISGRGKDSNTKYLLIPKAFKKEVVIGQSYRCKRIKHGFLFVKEI